MTTLIAYHGKQSIKKKYLNRVREHREADELVQREIGANGKGCAVWCTLNKYDHAAYQNELGIPEQLAYLEDCIFEGLPEKEAQEWPERFLAAITPGADLSGVWLKFVIWLLVDPQDGVIKVADEQGKLAIQQVADLYSDNCTERDRWVAAGTAARDAAWNATDAARSAVYAAYTAWSTADAAWTAGNAARDAAYAAGAGAAARDAAYVRQSEKLIELLKEAK